MADPPSLETMEMALRILLASALGGIIGLERERSDQPAGLRTHMLVGVGAALFTIVGAYGLADFGSAPGLDLDPTRIAAQVVTGIGFLGAGAIIQQGFSVRGLTTAASLWVTAAVGVAMGFGYWSAAVLTTGVTVVALLVFKELERRLFGARRAGDSESEEQ